MTDWKTIDSAPRGESLLLYVPFPYGIYHVVGVWAADDECWVDSYNHDDIADPTHWMPLPDPPE